MTPGSSTQVHDPLAGGGDMGALMRTIDWSMTLVGPVATWPQSLRTALSILLDTGFPMYIAWGPAFTQFYNDGYRPILGSTKHPAAMGISTRETFAEIWDIIGPMFQEVMAGKAITLVDFMLPLDRHGFSEECYFVFSYSPIREETGAVGGVLVTVTETTSRVLGARRLATLQALAAETREAQTVEEACRVAARVLATNTNDLPFTRLYLIDRDQTKAELTGASGVGPDVSTHVTIDLLDAGAPWPLGGVVRTHEPATVDLGDEGGRIVVLPVMQQSAASVLGVLVAGVSPRLLLDPDYHSFLSLVASQIGAAIASAQALQEAKARAQALAELDRAKTTFFSNVSHEFRTPLTLLLGPVQDALASTDGTLDRDQLTLVHRNAQRLLRLVNTLLDFSRIEAGRAQAAFEPTELSSLTREVAGTFRSLIESAGLRLDVVCEPIEAPAYVDRAMWEQIVLNLLSNAFKFTFEGAVTVTLRPIDHAIELRVQDTGTGIAASELPHLFDRFRRVEGARSRSFEGSGIGLALVQELVRMHGGTIEVESQEGIGTTFVVRVPSGADHLDPKQLGTSAGFVRKPADAMPYVEEAQRWLSDQPVAAAAPGGAQGEDVSARDDGDRSAQLLVVDDNADMRDYLRRVLEPHWCVATAVDGRGALAVLTAVRIDLVLTDVMMPGLDGFGLVQTLRSHAATRAIPVIMLSARAGEEARIDGVQAGADDYLVKPFGARELVARVRTQLEIARLRREGVAQHERLLSLFRVAPAAIAVFRGPTHVYELANERYLTLVGRADIIGKPGREALPELVDQGIWDLLDRVYATGEPFVTREFPVELDRLGTGVLDPGFFDFVIQPLKDAWGKSEGVLIHAVEVTEAVRARRQVEEARQAAELANRSKDEFLAMLGHELRNPLTPILTALQLMTLRGEVGAEKERAVIDRQVRHIARLVDDLLDVSRISRGNIELRRGRIELSQVVAHAIEMASPLIEERRHDLAVHVPSRGLAIDGDPARLNQIVLNLLTNAARYTEPHGRISVNAEQDGADVVLRVADSGIGIAAATLPRVFDLFVQERQPGTRSHEGLGLGLTIVRRLVELHGGVVSASSEGVGKGSEFIVRLPLA